MVAKRTAGKRSKAETSVARTPRGEPDVSKMLDELNDYHESDVGSVRMRVTMDPAPASGGYRTYHLLVNGKLVSTKKFSPGVGQKTHPFGGAGGVAEAVFRQAARS